jgi:signal transduction histidine kinase
MINEALQFLMDSDDHDIAMMIVDSNVHVVYSNHKTKQWFPANIGDPFPSNTRLYPVLRLCLEQQKRVQGFPISEVIGEETAYFVLFAYPIYENKSFRSLLVLLCESSPLHQYYESIASQEGLKLIGEMAAGTANVILNPLAVIKGTLQLMKVHLGTEFPFFDSAAHPLSERMQAYFRTLHEQVSIVDGHLQRFLLLGKPSKASLDPIPAVSFFHDVVVSAQRQALEKKIRLICEYPRNNGQFLGHEGHFREALFALIKNAIEAVGEGGSITLGIDITENSIHFNVSDNGEGIQPDLMPEIRKPFVTTKDDALGIGLSFSEMVIQKMGGTLDITSSPKGTKASVKVPKVN